jgi:hypothetical protein
LARTRACHPLFCLSGKAVGALVRRHDQNITNPLRAKANFTSHFNAIWVVQIARQK